jgi:hypothetical protein
VTRRSDLHHAGATGDPKLCDKFDDGYAAEYHVERYFREMVATQLAPVSREMTPWFIAEKALGLPKSY